MAAILANTGTNDWNTNGAWVGGVQPGIGDDVTIPASALVVIQSGVTAVCRSCTVSASGTLKWNATTGVLNIGDSTAGLGNIALNISSSATITLSSIGTINFVSTSATVQTLATGGKTLPVVAFNGVGGSWQNTDAWTNTSTTLTSGTWDTNGQSITLTTGLTLSGSTARTLTMGNSAFTFSRNTGTSITVGAATNLTVTANTATWTWTAATTTSIDLGTSINWNGLNIAHTSAAQSTSSIVTSGSTIASYTWVGPANKTATPTISGNLTITGAWSWTGNSAVNRSILASATIGTTVTITAATNTNTSNVDFKDITFAGAATWSGTSIGDSGGNSGMTFTTPVTQTNTGATGNWSDSSKWTSRVPLPQDPVVINTGVGNITVDMPRSGTGIDFTGFTGTFTHSLNMETYGSLTLASGMTYSGNSGWQFAARTSGITITSAGKTIGTSGIVFQGPGGVWTLQDALNTTGSIVHTDGTLNTNGFSVTTSVFTSSGARTRVLTLGSSTINVTNTSATTVWSMTVTGLTLSALSSTIVISTTSTNTRIFTGSTFSYGTLTYTVTGSTGQLTINTASLIDTLNFSDSTNARTLAYTSGNSFSHRVFNVFGTSGKLMTVKGVTAASSAFIELIGSVNTGMDFLSIQDIGSVIPGKWYAGTNSTNVSGTTNTNIAAAPTPGPYIDWLDTGTASGSSVTVNISSWHVPVNGKTLAAHYGSSASATSVNTPSGWSSSFGNTQQRQFTKVSDGTETSLTVTSTGAPAVANLYIMQLGGFGGTPTFDVSDSNSGSAITTLPTTATTGPTNTGTPAIAFAYYTGSGVLGISVSTTGSYEVAREVIGTFRFMAKTLTTLAAVSTTYTWNTSRNVTASMTVYKDVPSASVSDSTSITENVSVSVQAASGALSVNVSDTIGSSESLTELLTSNINVNDSTSISESVTKLLQSFVTVSDSTTISESIGRLLVSNILVNDSTTLSETIGQLLTSNAVANDSTTVTESVVMQQSALNLSVSDSTSITENISLTFSSTTDLAVLITPGIQQVNGVKIV